MCTVLCWLVTVIIALASLILWKALSAKPKLTKLTVGGFAKGKYEGILEEFKKLLENEREGLALAAYVNGELVVDLWGGFADSSSGRPWTENTMTCVYSISKTFGYLVVAKLVSDGKLRYEDKVTKYWPEFGQHGKDVLTVEDVMNHKAGLIGFCRKISLEDNSDTDKISSIIEQSKPYWKPGTAAGYHAITFGFLADQIVRRVDPKKRSVAQFFHDEISGKETEFYLALPKEKFHSMARITNFSRKEGLFAYLSHPLALVGMLMLQFRNRKLLNVTANAVSFLSVVEGEVFYNNPDVLATGNVAATGVGTARGVARAISKFFQGDVLTPEMKLSLSIPTEESNDIIANWTAHKGHGCLYFKHPVHDDKYLLAGVGHGGQLALFDKENNISIALLRNGLRPHTVFETNHLLPFQIIRTALNKT